MQQQRLQVFGRQTAECPHRYQHHRTQPADHRRHLHQRGHQQLHGTGETNPGAEVPQDLLPFRRCTPDQHRPHACGNHPASRQPHPKHQRTGEPHHHDPTQKPGRLHAGDHGADGCRQRGGGDAGVGGRGSTSDAIGGVRTCVRWAQQPPRHQRSGHHSRERRAGEQVSRVRARRARHTSAGGRIENRDQ